MFRLPIELVLALRYLRPRRTLVSAITLISVLGVTLGVAVLIIVISVMTGFDQEWHDRILGFNTDLKVLASRPIEEHAPLMREVKATPHVVGVAPFVMGKILIKTQPLEGSPLYEAPVVRGIDPEAEKTVSILPQSVRMGKFDLEGRGMLVGLELARLLDLRVGDRLAVYSPAQLDQMQTALDQGDKVAVMAEDYEVRGIFDVGFEDFNAMVVVTSLENAQDLYDLDGAIHGLMIKLDDPYRAHQVGMELQNKLGPGYTLLPWTQEHAALFGALVVEKNMIRFLLFFIVVVAAFGITSSLITFAIQKTREIGMLRALGAGTGQIMGLFLGQSGVVGSLGVGMGFFLGLTALAYRNEFLHFMNRTVGFNLLPPSIYRIYELPVQTTRADLWIICGGSLAICVVAGLIPAWMASRQQPVEALRHE